MNLAYPPKFFNFSWDHCNAQGKLETMVMYNFMGKTKCIMVSVTKVNYRKGVQLTFPKKG